MRLDAVSTSSVTPAVLRLSALASTTDGAELERTHDASTTALQRYGEQEPSS
jgi:hypothetical protein